VCDITCQEQRWIGSELRNVWIGQAVTFFTSRELCSVVFGVAEGKVVIFGLLKFLELKNDGFPTKFIYKAFCDESAKIYVKNVMDF
jgi:hypothetical protein